MSGLLVGSPVDPRSTFWYGLPHGYHEVDLKPSLEGLDEVVRQIKELPGEDRDRADQVFRLYAMVVMMLQKQEVRGCALGVHPDDNDGASLSVLTFTSVPLPGVNPQILLAKMSAGAGERLEDGVRPLDLPVGIGFLIESVHETVAPGTSDEGKDAPRREPVWQGTVAIPDARSSSVVAVQMVTSSVELAEDYRSVLLGVARTVTFTDPAQESYVEKATHPATADAGSIRNVFG